MSLSYPDTSLFINGKWRSASSNEWSNVINPATEEIVGKFAVAQTTDLDEALDAANLAYKTWKKVAPFARYKIMRAAAELLRQRADNVARIMTIEQGKPIAEAKGETLLGADTIDWFAEEGRRAYGRIIPSQIQNVNQIVIKEPVGPVAAFSPWNFPINQAVRKISGAIAAGCSIILKGPEDTPASCAELVKVFSDAGVPEGVINLVYGVPSDISNYLIPHPFIKKISFTGSTVVGKKLASLAAEHMKLSTMELGGHAPAIVFNDADLSSALDVLTAQKFRNAGQVCVAPTRFLIQDELYDQFVDGYVELSKNVKLGNGLDVDTTMGPLAHDRRLAAVEELVKNAVDLGATIRSGGQRVGNVGYFYPPTVMTDVPISSRIMNEEPFGPIIPISSFSSIDEVLTEANRLPYGLSAYAYTSSSEIADRVGQEIESGIIGINHHGQPAIETPFGGIQDSGHGKENGVEGLESYMHSKLISHKTTA
ncbi:MAG: NAD-dependent succinate-semialdehyde dehydrogenase [Paracoccaceae bacterium]|nr:NAD-dependent succinate-semialdehyde dehydrogenase [Paracoccaceae bacterium]